MMTVKNKDREHLMSGENPAWDVLYFSRAARSAERKDYENTGNGSGRFRGEEPVPVAV